MIVITPHQLYQLGLILVLVVTWAAAFKDLKTHTIPNGFPIAVLVLWLPFTVYAVYFGMGAQALGLQLLAGVVVFVVGLFAFATNIMGGGDVKLLSVIAPLVPFSHLHYLLVFISLAGLVWGLMSMGWGYFAGRASGMSHTMSLFSARKTELAYGPAIAAGLSCYACFVF